MQREEKTLSVSFKTGYAVVLAAKLLIFVICILMIMLTSTDLSIKALVGAIAFALFLAVSFTGLRTLNGILKKEGMNNVEWFMILSTFIVIIMIISVSFISPKKVLVYLLSISLVAGFTAGIMVGELIFLWKLSVQKQKR